MEIAKIHRADKLDNLLVFKATYHRFQFSRHSHEDFALGLMDQGVQCFSCRGRTHHVLQGNMITVNPDEIHDGKSADKNPYRYRLLYIPSTLVEEIGAAAGNKITSQYFRSPVTRDRDLAARLGYLFMMFEDPLSDEVETHTVFLSLLNDLFLRHGTEAKQPSTAAASIPTSLEMARAYIQDMAGENIHLNDMAKAAGLSRYHFLRSFTLAYGISPHAFLLNRRLQMAKTALRGGRSISDAAMTTGFFDQSHLTRRFKAAFGITPRQYQKAVG